MFMSFAAGPDSEEHVLMPSVAFLATATAFGGLTGVVGIAVHSWHSRSILSDACIRLVSAPSVAGVPSAQRSGSACP